MNKEFREPKGYSLGHAYNRVVYTEFKNLDYRPEWCKGWSWGKDIPPPVAYQFSRDPGDGMQEDDLYGLLEVDNTCSMLDIKKQFHQQSRKWHPDKCPTAHAATRTRWIHSAFKILSNPEARAFWDRRIDRKDRERRRVVIQPKRRPQIRGSAARTSASAKAPAAPLHREAERLAAHRVRSGIAQQAISVWIDTFNPGEDDEQKAVRIYTELDGVYETIMLSDANTVEEFLTAIEQYHRDKTKDRLGREWIAARDAMDRQWQDGLKAEPVLYHLKKFAVHYDQLLLGHDECSTFLKRSTADSFVEFIQEVKQHIASARSTC